MKHIDVINNLKPLLQVIEHFPPEAWWVLLTAVTLLFAGWWGKKRHLLSMLEAYQELKRLRGKPADHQITHLRGVDPFVFEEMILTAIKRQGHKIQRNKRYTGDGGIDGRCTINGQEFLVQAKRYKAHINPQHVIEFAGICKRQNKRGLFVHTGKTGPKSKDVARNTKIEMISGQRLLNLLLNQPKGHSQGDTL
ncbi:MAG: restriction endonuclease [Alphaproteobacteria bacterium]